MNTTFKALALTASVIGSTAFADPLEDAQYIVDQTVTKEIFEGTFVALGPVLTSAIQNDLRAQGITLPNPERFMELFISEFIDEFTESMRVQSVSIYLDQFNAEELEAIAAFYRSDAGQSLVAATPEIMLQSSAIGEVAGQQAGMNAGPRLADRIEKEGLLEVDDPSLLESLIDALR